MIVSKFKDFLNFSFMPARQKNQKKPARIPPQTPPPRGQNQKQISLGFAKIHIPRK